MKYIQKPRIIDVMLITDKTTVQEIEAFMKSFDDPIVYRQETEDYGATGVRKTIVETNRVGSAGKKVYIFFPPNLRYENSVQCRECTPGKFLVRIGDEHNIWKSNYDVWERAFLENDYVKN